MNILYDIQPAKDSSALALSNNPLKFGVLRSKHMFLCDYSEGEWKNPRIVPYGKLELFPGAMALHYGQSIFEGAKAFYHEKDKEIYCFRLDKNAERLNYSAQILAMPSIPPALHIEGVQRLIDVDREYCPKQAESSLYIRSFMFATQDCLGVAPSKEYTFCVILSPSGPYYSGGFSKALRLYISSEFHRAAPGGTGAAKASGNYAASLRASNYAHEKKADQVLYLDTTNTYIEEAGSMNHYHVTRDGIFVIPEFTDTILRSITSLSVLELGKMGKFAVQQKRIAVNDFIKQIKAGEIIEAGGLGTAAVVSPVGRYLLASGEEIVVGNGEIGKYSRELYTYYSGLQTGLNQAPDGWLQKVPRFI